MLGLCLIPVAFALYTHTLQFPHHHSDDIGGLSAEVQTCRDGLGGRVAFNDQFVQMGPQFGYTIPLGDDWSITLNVHGGLGYSNTFHPLSRVRQVTTINVGASVSLNLAHYSLKFGMDHMSNGSGFNPTNVGQDMLSIGIGRSF